MVIIQLYNGSSLLCCEITLKVVNNAYAIHSTRFSNSKTSPCACAEIPCFQVYSQSAVRVPVSPRMLHGLGFCVNYYY